MLFFKNFSFYNEFLLLAVGDSFWAVGVFVLLVFGRGRRGICLCTANELLTNFLMAVCLAPWRAVGGYLSPFVERGRMMKA